MNYLFGSLLDVSKFVIQLKAKLWKEEVITQ